MASRVVLGVLPGGGYGLRVSRPGFDVLSASAPNQLSFDSRWSFTARVHMEGSISCPRVGSAGVYTNVSLGVDFGVPPPVLVSITTGGTQGPSDGGIRSWSNTGNYDQFVRIYSSFMAFIHPTSILEPTPRVYKYLVLRPY